MKLLKRLVLVIGILIILLIVGAFVFVMNLDRLVASTVRSQGTEQLNLQTDLSSASVSLMGGELGLSDLQIASPKGFEAPHMLTLGKANVKVSYGQLRSDPVHVQEITFDKPVMVIEQRNGTFNFRQAMEQMPGSKPASPAGGTPSGEKTPVDKAPSQTKAPSGASSAAKPPLKLTIDALTIKDAQVILRPNIPGLANEITIPVSTFTLKNIGNANDAQNGAALKDVAQQVFTALAAQANSSNLIPEQLRGLLHGDLSAVVSQLGAQAQERLTKALPGDAGKLLGNLAADPKAVLKNPGQVIQQQLQNLGGSNATTQPAVPKQAQDLLGGLLGGKHKDKSAK